MMLKKIIYRLITILLFVSCNNIIIYKSTNFIYAQNIQKKNRKLTAEEWKVWYQKDIVTDTIPGISLDKAYNDLLKNKNADTIIVALIDGRIDTAHLEIKNALWLNENEIANNNIDDDQNGYIDDIHGWNFLGNNKGEQLYRASFEYVRILRKYEPFFKDMTESKIPRKYKKIYNLYKRALKEYDARLKLTNSNIKYLDSLILRKNEIHAEFSKLFPETELNNKFLDSLLNRDNDIKDKILDYKSLVKNHDWVVNRLKSEKRYLTIYLNKEVDDRMIIGDDSSNINDIEYGNNKIGIDSSENRHAHGIKIIGIIAADRNNKTGIKGITNLSKIMALTVAPYGDIHDKDVALAIRYAVDNGAKVINMSIGKSFSLNEEWVYDAIRYAEKNDVLIVTSASNGGINLDLQENFNYPNDAKNHKGEIVKNFIKVGSSNHTADSLLVSEYSNYGKMEVDIFAPGQYIYTTFNDNKYNYDSGTSLSAAIVSGVAALIRSYYPNLSAAEVKQIIMESGVSYDIMVLKPYADGEKRDPTKVPFGSLSKSGKIVNAYNALLMAEEVSKKKKKRK